MAKWWKFGLGKDKGREEAPPPAPTTPPSTPAPAAPAEGGKKPGLLGRLFGRGRKAKEVPAEAPPAAPPTPPTAEPTPPPTAPPEVEVPPEAPAEGPPPSVPPKPERVYPPFLHVSADGDWVISETEWEGVMSGTLHGADVKTFIDAMEAEGGPDYEVAIPLIADAYGIPGGLINIGRSTIRSVDY